MSALLNSRGQAIEDSKGEQLKVGMTIVDEMFGDGIVRGTTYTRCVCVRMYIYRHTYDVRMYVHVHTYNVHTY